MVGYGSSHAWSGKGGLGSWRTSRPPEVVAEFRTTPTPEDPLLRELPKDLEGLLLTVARLDGQARELLKGKDREKVWEDLPPTERQLGFLGSLGYQGPPPKTLRKASALIEALLTERTRGSTYDDQKARDV